MSEDMRGLFFIVKGQYRKGLEPSFVNPISEGTQYIGGFDPYSDDTEEWYKLMDCKTFTCHCCSGSLEKVLKGVYNVITSYKGNAKNYFKAISEAPSTSPIMRCLWEEVYNEFGHYYSDEIEEMEDLAYNDIREEKPLNKARKLVSKNKTKIGMVNTPSAKEMVVETPTPKKVQSRVKMGIKKLSLEV